MAFKVILLIVFAVTYIEAKPLKDEDPLFLEEKGLRREMENSMEALQKRLKEVDETIRKFMRETADFQTQNAHLVELLTTLSGAETIPRDLNYDLNEMKKLVPLPDEEIDRLFPGELRNDPQVLDLLATYTKWGQKILAIVEKIQKKHPNSS